MCDNVESLSTTSASKLETPCAETTHPCCTSSGGHCQVNKFIVLSSSKEKLLDVGSILLKSVYLHFVMFVLGIVTKCLPCPHELVNCFVHD